MTHPDSPALKPAAIHTKYRLTVDQYRAFRRDGFLIVRGLVSPAEVAELRQHTFDLMQGKLPEQQGHNMAGRDPNKDSGVTVQGLEAPPDHLSPDEKAQFFLRIHMLHRKLELHERYLLHPGILDVLEILIGPDVLAMQSMLFLKPPGKPGQGWHQDSYYIPTHPNTLCGAWIAIDDCDEINGAMWFAKGSQQEPVYPPADGYGFGDRTIADIHTVANVSDPNDAVNGLASVADRYDQILGSVQAGDVVFFDGHVLHRSKLNYSHDRSRRSFVGHYCNARSFTQWGAEDAAPGETQPSPRHRDPVSGMTNGSHILARGDTHLPFAEPRFGTPCAALLTPAERHQQSIIVQSAMGDLASGDMGVKPAEPEIDHKH